MKIAVLKFGGASVATPENFSHVADIILDKLNHYDNVVVVVSAMAGMTDSLMSLANIINDNPPKREVDMLVSVGERISISLLAMALYKKNIKAISLTGSQSGIITCVKHSEARIIDIKPKRIIEQLKNGKVVIVAGFQGVSTTKEITTLGRGGSDTSAVALAIALRAAKVEFYKDVEGVANKDPKMDKNAKIYKQLSYDDAMEIVGNSLKKVLHPRCIHLAKNNNIQLHVRSFKSFFKKNNNYGTFIGNFSLEKQDKCVYEKEEVFLF
jgi:aspartate kinase